MKEAKQPFRLVYDPEIVQHLKQIERKYHSLIRRVIEQQLSYEPGIETRNRKPLLRQIEPSGVWEIRFGPSNRFRVFYEICLEDHEVHILAIGVKVGSRLFVGGEEFEL